MPANNNMLLPPSGKSGHKKKRGIIAVEGCMSKVFYRRRVSTD
jgi:hypothetical protein